MMKATRFDEHLAQNDKSNYFSGNVRKQELVMSADSGELELLAVFFSAGARTIPHIHEKDQVLHFVQGKGVVATESEKRICTAGDIITVPGGVWHWHGATRDTAMCHISIRQPGGTNWQVEMKNWTSGYDE